MSPLLLTTYYYYSSATTTTTITSEQPPNTSTPLHNNSNNNNNNNNRRIVTTATTARRASHSVSSSRRLLGLFWQSNYLAALLTLWWWCFTFLTIFGSRTTAVVVLAHPPFHSYHGDNIITTRTQQHHHLVVVDHNTKKQKKNIINMMMGGSKWMMLRQRCAAATSSSTLAFVTTPPPLRTTVAAASTTTTDRLQFQQQRCGYHASPFCLQAMKRSPGGARRRRGGGGAGSAGGANSDREGDTFGVDYFYRDAAGIDTEHEEGLSLDAIMASRHGRRPVVQWYPGHIAKAERRLRDTFLKAVDVVVEVRDARAARATSHPQVPEWCGTQKPRVLVLTHVDQIPPASREALSKQYGGRGIDCHRPKQKDEAATGLTSSTSSSSSSKEEEEGGGRGESFFFVNAKEGAGIHRLVRAIIQRGAPVQERRRRRGLLERPLRVGVLGYPNVGKSALINRLVRVGATAAGSTGKTKRARTANTPGVTRSLQWIRVRGNGGTSGKEFELLDAPGIIPAALVDQTDAALLAACNCIGTAAYDNQVVATFLCDYMIHMHQTNEAPEDSAPQWRRQCLNRYGFDPLQPPVSDNVIPNMYDDDDDDEEEETAAVEPMTGDDMLHMVAENTCRGSLEDAARKILQDFRTGRMGAVCLQAGSADAAADTQRTAAGPLDFDGIEAAAYRRMYRQRQEQQEEAIQERARVAVKTAKERGLELPPMMTSSSHDEKVDSSSSTEEDENAKENSSGDSSQVGKGLFDGW